MFNIEEQLKILPDKPGVYIMHDVDDKIIYVGKAVNLKRRVKSYFRKTDKTERIKRMVSLIDHFEYIVVDNEAEALILECNLIKKNRPKFNVLLKDDKTYPYIKIDIKSDYPNVTITRKIINDGSKYFGPYANPGAAKEMLDFIKQKYKIRQCKNFRSETRACLNYHINRCLGPCMGYVSKEDYRKQIDEIDNELIPLLLKRMSVSEQVAQYKAERGMPVLNSEREQQILDDVASKCGKHGDTIKTVFSATMDASRALQHKIIGGGKELRADIENAIKIDKLDTCGKPIACQGVEGAYSGVTSKKIFPEASIHFHKRFEDVFEAVNRGDSKFGIIPVENSTAGSVHESYDLIMKYRFYIVGAYDLKIEHCLCAKNDTKYEDITDVYSHPQALSQCNNFLRNFDFTGINYSNTAAAAKYVSESDKNNIAVICSELAAKKYNLKILKRNIQNNNKNTTRFFDFFEKLKILLQY